LSSRDRAALETLFFAGSVETAACRLLQHYPALARLWAVQVEFWSCFVEELLKHARSFKGANTRLEGSRLIKSLQLDLSDLHEGNRSVARIRFVDGSCWFYKPRSGQCEKAWFDLLAWVNSTGFPLRFKVVKVVCAERHCWMEEVAHRQCKNRGEVEDYFFRAGALLCLVHWLGGVDFHAGNIIANGAHPVIVDCETFFHPATRLPATAKAEERSLLRTGMLPIHRRKASLSDSVSAFGRVSFGPHSVRLNGKVVFAENFRDEVMEGFHQMFTHLHSHVKKTGMRRMITRLRRAPCRTIYRPTSRYYAVLAASLRPAFLTSGAARSRFLVATCRKGHTPPFAWKEEAGALENGDIPIFRAQGSALRRYTRQAMQRDMKILAQMLAPTAARAARYTARRL
jgi:lantibiotic modifying enzyme